jgi:hypothetical protein
LVHLTDAKRLGISLLRATGSRQHLDMLEERATARQMALGPEGLRKGRKIVAAKTEAEIYSALGLQFIEPELREGLDEIALAEAHRIPARRPACPHRRLGRRRHAEVMAEASIAHDYSWKAPKTSRFWRVCDSIGQVCAGGRRCVGSLDFSMLMSG